MYWLRRRLYSQNFFTNRELIRKLIRSSSISSKDTVLDIGAGSGFITRELAKVAAKVIALEIDPGLASRLPKLKNVTPVCQSITDFPLPDTPYKVFSNIPFSKTADIIRKLLHSPSSPEDSYLIVQAEAADKFTLGQVSNTMSALLYYPWWEINITYRFDRRDFHPIPKVDSVLLRICHRQKPLVSNTQQIRYYDFIAHNFVYSSQSKFVPPVEWLIRFNKIKNQTYSGAYAKLLKYQQKLKKIHRSRSEKNWKMFKNNI
ncbi:hypothetical protein A2972_03995 [Candidatus Amesbacteria bacterium RIFCSPLOWO2_01_FULL_47_33]|uniref:Ribosomal RNA adenine methylase transferase N-terminal domain-containing protein n=2 Tax=Candidatus Amesiibacteriota TaxID=1752730 RepID=A0A1F4Z380_9BACT|nr:MAG: hypothetical protein A2972_03995 [Candidatus Amesbacteria bacterium RIFCSPLOWO2_01_FULL_47_33]